MSQCVSSACGDVCISHLCGFVGDVVHTHADENEEVRTRLDAFVTLGSPSQSVHRLSKSQEGHLKANCRKVHAEKSDVST